MEIDTLRGIMKQEENYKVCVWQNDEEGVCGWECGDPLTYSSEVWPSLLYTCLQACLGPGGLREPREACLNHGHLSW